MPTPIINPNLDQKDFDKALENRNHADYLGWMFLVNNRAIIEWGIQGSVKGDYIDQEQADELLEELDEIISNRYDANDALMKLISVARIPVQVQEKKLI